MIEEHNNTKAKVELLLKHLQAHVVEMPSSMLWEIYELMMETATSLLQACNRQRPLLRLPNETLGQIISYVPESREVKEDDLRPVWGSAAMDTLMLLPISQTCHRLRSVTLGNPFLWRHLHSTYPAVAVKELMSRSGTLPLTVVIHDHEFQYIRLLNDTHLRVQELHIVHMDMMTPCHLLSVFFKLPWPHLQNLSLTHTEDTMWNGDEPIPLSSAPQLRYLHLQHISIFVSGAVRNLTHLSLSMLHLRECHAHVAAFISSCSNLVNATFDGMTNPITPRLRPTGADLPYLKRVTFHNMTTPIIQFYLAVLSYPRPGLALQVLSPGFIPLRQFPFGTMLPQYAKDGVSLLAIGGHLPPQDVEGSEDDDAPSTKLLLSVTASSETNTLRFCRTYDVMTQHLHRIIIDERSSRWSYLREIWIADVPPAYSESLTHTLSSVLASLPALETITAVLDHSQYPEARPNLRLLPRCSNTCLENTRLKTLRLVHGYSPHAHWSGPPYVGAALKLSLKKLLLQLSSREYDYLETLILQTTPQFYVDVGELDEVAEHIPTTRHETIDVLPPMPIPDYCVEPASGWKAAFPASLW